VDLNGLELGEVATTNTIGCIDTIFSRSHLSSDEKIDLAELFIINTLGGQVQNFGEEADCCKLTHRFTPGMYIREIFMPAGSVVTTKIHKSEHPFVVSQGLVAVYSGQDGPQVIQAPHCGITKPGTRRFLVVLEDTVWTTFHLNPNNLTDVGKLEMELCAHRNNLLLPISCRPREFQQLVDGGLPI